MMHYVGARAEVAPFTRLDLDITDGQAVAAAMADARPDVILNCAAYNAVDAAEDSPVEALQTNAIAVRHLARAAVDCDATLVHYSSDFVFDGTGDRPYSEEDPPNPRSVYAASKLLGEWFAEDAPRAYVLRVESLFGRAPRGPAKGSVETILRALKAGEAARVFEDRTVSPSYVWDVAAATWQLVDSKAPPGVYHCVNAGQCLWIDFAREAVRQLGLEPRLQPVRVADVKLKAERPRYCALSIDKLTAAGVSMPTWEDALSRYLRDG
jgi:dTDP-4-dehydrorhamnose reductase